jgi:hypothetical protein
MSGASNLTLRIAGALKDRCTHQVMPSVALEAGLIISPEADGMSKRDRALDALDGKSLRELGEVARRHYRVAPVHLWQNSPFALSAFASRAIGTT